MLIKRWKLVGARRLQQHLLYMSRNKEKSQSVLHRFQALKDEEAGVLQSNPNLRPKSVQSVTSLPQAEKWRSTLISEISVKLTRINNPELNDYQIRDINDEINKNFKEKRAWEYHIRSLGGPDYISSHIDKVSIRSGIELNGYRYFGRAKELPDVKKVLENKKLEGEQRRTAVEKEQEYQKLLHELEQRATPSYYGFYDEVETSDDIGTVTNMSALIDEVNEAAGLQVIEPVHLHNENYHTKVKDELLLFERKTERQLKNNTVDIKLETVEFVEDIPSNGVISKWLVEKKKKELLARLKKEGDS